MCLRIFNPYHFLWLFSFLNNFLQEGNLLEKQMYLCLFHILSLAVNSQRCQIAQQVTLKIIWSWKVTRNHFCINYCLWLSCLGYLLFHGSYWALRLLSHAMAWVTVTQQWQAARDCTTQLSFATKQSLAFRLMCTLSCHTTQYHILVSAMVPALLLFGATKLCQGTTGWLWIEAKRIQCEGSDSASHNCLNDF